MPSIKTSLAVAATPLFLGAQAQVRYYIEPTSVPIATRNRWCDAQKLSCPYICAQTPAASSQTEANDCDPETLDYNCLCSDGNVPNATEFTETLPYFICTEYGNQCVAACNGNTPCQSACRADNPCGAQNPTRVNITTTTSSTSLPAGATSGSAGVVFNGLGGAAAATTGASGSGSGSGSGAQAALDLGRAYGLAIVFSGIFVGFALVM